MPLPAEVVEPWEAATGGYLVEGYGLTECSPVLMANPVADQPQARHGRAAAAGDRDAGRRPRRPDRGPRAGRRGRAHRARPAGVLRLLGKPEETEAVVRRRRLVPHGRHRHDRRRRLRAHRRPHQGAHHHGRLQRRADRGRERDPRSTRTSRTPLSSGLPERALAARRSSPPSCSQAGATTSTRRPSATSRASSLTAVQGAAAHLVRSTTCRKSLIGKVLRRQVRNGLLEG